MARYILSALSISNYALETIFADTSSATMNLQTLARQTGTTTAKAERFLVELANMLPSKDAHARIVKLFPEFFPDALRNTELADSLREWLYKVSPVGAGGFLTRGEWTEEIDGQKVIFGRRSHDETLQIVRGVFLNYLQYVFLPAVWACNDIPRAHWAIFGTRLFFRGPAPSKTFLEALVEPPPPTPFDVAMLYLGENVHRTRKCQLSDCPTPYFFQKKKGQKYCSDQCSSAAQREIQARWWREQGNRWRARRKSEGKKTKKKRKRQ